MLSETSKKNKIFKDTTTMTFRLDSNFLKKLYWKAEEDDISLNTLVNQIIKRYVEWDMFESKTGMVPVSKPVVKDLFQRLSKEEVIEIATKIAKNAVYDATLFMKGKVDQRSFMSWFLSRMKNCSEISSNDDEDGNSTYILKHDLGENWSLYHKIIVESIFSEVVQLPIYTSMTSSTLVIKFRNNRDHI